MSTTITKYFLNLALTPFSKATPNAPSSGPSLICFKRFSPQHFRSRFYSSSSSAACSAHPDTITASRDTEASPEYVRHPWPEWVAFIDRLKTNGYFSQNTLPFPDNAANHYKEMNLLKDACLSFARDRYDIFESLSMKDIETVVEGGCPNLLRKAVNSAKRLRAYVRLDEGEVCSTCNLRGSCDRSYVVLKGEEASGRTVDVVRLLLFYALDPLVISGGQKPPGRERVELSAKKLLFELLKLSKASPAPVPWKPAAKPSSMSLMDDEFSQNCVMKRGDWMCSKCNFMNFAKNLRCRKCKEDGPRSAGENNIETKKGDWSCSNCNFVNFARNKCCLKCKAEKPDSEETLTPTAKKGDWNCPNCNFVNFARNKCCLKCKAEKPDSEETLTPTAKKGDWNCPNCNFVNFARNKCCLKCKAEKPDSEETLTPTAKKGDWNCPKCDFMNFASKKKCLRCEESRPMKHGEWYCPSCDYMNFARNLVCLKCNCKRFEEAASNV